MTFTTYQLSLITHAEALGYGYSIFAGNVRKQGSCSPVQEEALARMTAAGEFRKNNWAATATSVAVAAQSTTFQTTKPPGRATIFKVQHANVQTRS